MALGARIEEGDDCPPFGHRERATDADPSEPGFYDHSEPGRPRPRVPPDSETLIPISDVLESVKTSIGRQVKSFLRAVWADQRTLGDRRLDEWAIARRRSKPIWTPRGIDFNVMTEQRLLQKLDYCYANPVKRGLVDRAELRHWSSLILRA